MRRARKRAVRKRGGRRVRALGVAAWARNVPNVIRPKTSHADSLHSPPVKQSSDNAVCASGPIAMELRTKIWLNPTIMTRPANCSGVTVSQYACE